jgi:hypothetical protein
MEAGNAHDHTHEVSTHGHSHDHHEHCGADGLNTISNLINIGKGKLSVV